MARIWTHGFDMLECVPGGGDPHVDLYRVGILADLRRLRLGLLRCTGRRREVLATFRYQIRIGVVDRVRRRQWRTLRNYFNGYLAEHRLFAVDAGHGWTRRRAVRGLYRNIDRTMLGIGS